MSEEYNTDNSKHNNTKPGRKLRFKSGTPLTPTIVSLLGSLVFWAAVILIVMSFPDNCPSCGMAAIGLVMPGLVISVLALTSNVIGIYRSVKTNEKRARNLTLNILGLLINPATVIIVGSVTESIIEGGL